LVTSEQRVNHIDTASFYFSSLRSANELINTALAPYPDDLVIVTKVGPGRDPWGEWYWARPDQLRGQVRLAWTLHQAPNVLAIPGTGSPAHLAENVAAAALRLSSDDLALLS
jgi:aryl-alcohol dehydrogenase-like predicted oxidoreductase